MAPNLSNQAIGLSAVPRVSTPNHFLRRVGWLVVLLGVEWVPISAFVSTGRGGQSAARALVAFLFFLCTFGYFKVRGKLPGISRQIEGRPVSWRWFLAHISLMAAFLGISLLAVQGGLIGAALTACWYAAGILAILLAACAFVPLRLWLDLLRGAIDVCVLAAIVAAIAWRFVIPLWSAWDGTPWTPAIDATFHFTKILLKPFFSDLIADRAKLEMGTSRFAVTIGGPCAGLEGAGLMFAFSAGWLWFFRRECRFPQALLLIPVSIGVMWVLNAVRIAVLIMIGNAGFPSVAMSGFHSQAGWISFNVVALGVSVAAQRGPWFRGKTSQQASTPTISENPTAVYLMPFLAILAAAMLSRAASGNFEWLYPVRLFAAAGTLWFFRKQYARLDWRVSWFGPVIGVLVFVMWMSLEPGTHSLNGFPSTLAAAPAFARIAWLVCRTLAAVVTVPIAEELAFRGFLIRRLMARDFESLDFRAFSYLAVLISSLAFGFMHGDRWLAGTLAGILYAIAFLRRGRIGDTVVAHATTNAIIAASVLFEGKWYLW